MKNGRAIFSLFLALSLVSCKKNSDQVSDNPDKTRLKAVIYLLTTVYNAPAEGLYPVLSVFLPSTNWLIWDGFYKLIK